MNRKKSWTDEQLIQAVAANFSYRSVIIELGLIPAGGNYSQIKQRIYELKLPTDHFTGMLWSAGKKLPYLPYQTLDKVLVVNSRFQSHKLKQRLYLAGLKKPECELCGWAQVSEDGRIPVELDHINGDHFDNRIENLRILCPNCHSLQLTHRGRNIKQRKT